MNINETGIFSGGWFRGMQNIVRKLVDKISDRGFGFAVVQTVFEGADVNTEQRLLETQLRYDLAIPFGHDAAVGHYPSVMTD